MLARRSITQIFSMQALWGQRSNEAKRSVVTAFLFRQVNLSASG